MEVGNTSIVDVRQQLGRSAPRVWVRALLVPEPGGQPLRLLYAQALIGPRPPGWVEETWRYEQGTFVATSQSARGFLSRLRPGRATELTLGDLVATVSIRQGSFGWRHHPSRTQHDQLQLEWPSLEFEPGIDGVESRAYALQSGFLVGFGDVPSFPAFAGAFNAFFFGNYSVTGSNNPILDRLDIRLLDQRARFRRVHVRATAVDVWLGGRGLAGLTLELNGATYRTAVPITKPGRLTLPLPSGLPSDAWLWLKRDGQWLDYRSLGGWTAYRSSDVTFETTVDPEAEVTALANQGEGEQLEYKIKLPDTRDEKRATYKTVAAFANGGGGTLIFGVSDGDGIAGLPGHLPQQRRRLTDMLHAMIRPQPQFRIAAYTISGRNLLVLRVPPNNGQVYALTLDTERPEYYVRRDGTTFPANPEELTQIVASHQVITTGPFGGQIGLV